MFTQDGPAGEQGMVSMIIANPVAKDPSTLIIPEHYAIGLTQQLLFAEQPSSNYRDLLTCFF